MRIEEKRKDPPKPRRKKRSGRGSLEKNGAPDFPGRLRRVRRAMASEGIPALVVCRLANIRYLTGFTGSSAILLVGHDDACFITDGRYDEQAHLELESSSFSGDIMIYGAESLADSIKAAARKAREKRIFVEADAATWSFVLQLKKWLRGYKIEPASNLVERIRASKDAWELARLQEAARLTDEAFAAAQGWIRAGVTEREIARRLIDFFEDAGAEGISFEPIVASGPRSALPHARAGERRIEKGDLVVLDFGCRLEGYCSDMTRTVAVGPPDGETRRLYSIVRRANGEGIRAVSANRMAGNIDAAARNVIRSAGLAEYFVHSTGHGLGIEVHEWPRIGKGVVDRVPLDCVITIEPGVYLPGLGGIRIEDMVVATRGGRRVLTRSPTGLIVL